MSSDEDRDVIYENRYRQDDPEAGEAPSDEEAEMAAYLAAKAEATPAKKDLKNDEHALNQKLQDVTGEPKLKGLNVPFTRPNDYFAEMVKSDAHMQKVRQSLVSEKKRIEEAEERKKQRELKKFGKKVQTAKMVERAKEKKTHMDTLKKWRKDHAGEEFAIGLDAGAKEKKFQKGGHKGDNKHLVPGGPTAEGKDRKDGKNKKREFKDGKYGFGGGKRHAKDNTAESVNDFKFDKKRNRELPGSLKSKFGLKRGPAKKIAKGGRKGGPGGGKGASAGGKKRPGKRARTSGKK